MKRLLKIIIPAFILLFLFTTTAKAAGNVSATFSGSNSVTVGSTVTLNLSINSVQGSADGKVYAFGGYITFDPEYLQYQSWSGANSWTGSTGSLGTGRIKVSTVDFSMANGVSSGSIGTIKFKALKAGNTTVTMNTIEATDQEKNLDVSFSGKTVTINEYVPPTPKSNDSTLKSLSVSDYSITPAFSAGTKSYSVTVPSGTSSVNVVAAANDSKATVSGTGVVSLSSDTTTATVKVTAEDGSTSNYTITINREKKDDPTPTPTPTPDKKSSDASLKSLDVSGYTLYPRFSSGTKTYSMKVANGVTGLRVTAIPTDSKASVSISGNSNWKEGVNPVKITVTAEDGTKAVYTVNVTRASAKEKSSDTNVSLNILSPHTITPNFSNKTNEYYVTVPNDVTKLDLTVTPYDKDTSVKISGNKDFELGKENKVTIKVTAEDGTTKTITLNVTRSEKSSSAELLDLKVRRFILEPDFKPSITKYTVDVDEKTNKLDLVVKVSDGLTYEIEGNENFQPGKNVVLVKVTDKEGFEKYYQITVNKKAKEKFLGIGWIPFLILLAILLLLLWLLYLFLKKRKDKEPEIEKTQPINIDFKPEFNFNSGNGTDDDVIYSNGNLTAGTDFQKAAKEAELVNETKQLKDAEEVYDMYDDVVTKDELIDAMNEGIETKNTEKLEMLLEQDKLNKKKEAIKKKSSK